MAAKLEFRLTLYPDPLLRKVAAPVAQFDDDLRRTVEAMFELMYKSKGVGLAAPQAGLDRRVLVLDPSGEGQEPLALVNPRIIERSGPESSYEEGCLSFPAIYADVKRPERCRVVAHTPDGTAIDREFSGFTSRIVQHEYDHLEGVLLVDRMSLADKQRHKAALQELVEDFKRNRAAALAARR